MQQLFNISLVADTGGLSENLIVRAATGKKAAKASGATAALIGVALYDVAAGQTGTIQTHGVARVKLGGTVAAGDPITSDANGQGVAAAPAVGVNAYIVGVALEAGVSGDLIDVLIAPGRIQG